jgi:hypothetical protein
LERVNGLEHKVKLDGTVDTPYFCGVGGGGEQICRKFLRDTIGEIFKDKNGNPEPFSKARPDFLRNPEGKTVHSIWR